MSPLHSMPCLRIACGQWASRVLLNSRLGRCRFRLLRRAWLCWPPQIIIKTGHWNNRKCHLRAPHQGCKPASAFSESFIRPHLRPALFFSTFSLVYCAPAYGQRPVSWPTVKNYVATARAKALPRRLRLLCLISVQPTSFRVLLPGPGLAACPLPPDADHDIH